MPNGGASRTITTRLTLDPSGYVTGVTVADRSTEQFSRNSKRNLSSLSSEFTTLGIAVAAAGAAIAAGLASATRSAFAFEAELTKSVTLIGISREEMDQMGQAALRMGDTGQGPQALAESLFFVQSAGLRGATALDTAEQAAKAASIGLGETSVVADLTTSAMNAYGAETLDASQATDILVGTVREGKAEAPELASAMGRVLPIASEMGVSFDEVGGAIAAMTRTGTDAATSTTQLRAILTSLLNPAQKSEEAMSELGLSSQLLRDTIQEDGLWAAMSLLRDSIGDNDAALGQIIPNVRALAGFLDLTGSNAEENAEIFDRMSDSTGLADEAFEEWSQTTEAAVARFRASMEAAGISLGQHLLPAVGLLADVGTQIFDTFAELPDGLQRAVVITSALGAAVLITGGAFLLLLPRIIATRAALSTLAVTAPRASRAIGLLGRAAGLVGGLLLVASAISAISEAANRAEIGVGEMSNALADLRRGEANQAIDTLIGRVEEIGDRSLFESVIRNFDSVAGASKLFGDESEKLANELKVVDESLAGLVQQGNADLAEESFQALSERWEEAGGNVENLIDRFPGYQDALEGADAEQKNTQDSAQGLTGELEAEAIASEEATTALDEYIDSLRAASDPVFALQSALNSVEDAQDAYNEAVDEYGKDSEEARQASFDLADAVSNLEQAALDGDLSFDEFERKLQQWVEQGDITGRQADDIRERVEELRGEAEDYQDTYTAVIEQQGAAEAQLQMRNTQTRAEAVDDSDPNIDVTTSGVNTAAQQMQDLLGSMNEFDGKTVTARVSALFGSRFSGGMAEGGEVKGPGGPTDDQAGMYALSNNEWVIRAEAAKKYGSGVMDAINRGVAEIYGGPDSTIRIRGESEFDATDFADDVSRLRDSMSGSGRVLPVGSYRIGRGTAGHGYPALDLPAPTGTPVFAVAPGVVSRALRLGYSYGVHAFINHAGGRQSRYAHLSSLLVGAGDEVRRGQLIGRVGSTGNSTGPHLHYEDLINGLRRSPSALGIFDRGGIWPSGTIGLNASGRDEMVLDPDMTELFRGINRQLSRMRVSGPELGQGGSSTNGDIARFEGNLYLDGGEFLGKVRGVARSVVNDHDHNTKRRVGQGAGRNR